MPKDFAKPGIDGQAAVRRSPRTNRWVELGLLVVVCFELVWLFHSDLAAVQHKYLSASLPATVTTDQPLMILSNRLAKGYYVWARFNKPCLQGSSSEKLSAFKVTQINDPSQCSVLMGPLGTMDTSFQAFHALSEIRRLIDVQVKVVS